MIFTRCCRTIQTELSMGECICSSVILVLFCQCQLVVISYPQCFIGPDMQKKLQNCKLWKSYSFQTNCSGKAFVIRILEISLQILFITIEECLKTFIKKDFFIFIHICCWFCRAQNVAQRKRFVKLVDSVRECGGDVKIFSSMHISGERKLLMLYQHLSTTIILYIGNIFKSY